MARSAALKQCKCGRGPVMPSTTGKSGTRAGFCKDCHYERIKRYRATPNGQMVNRAISKRWRAKLRAEVVEAYGGRCECCGETHPVFLTLDHINNDGGGRNRTVNGVAWYLQLRKAGWPKDGLRLLCFNCNTGRHINGGICPHEE